MADNCDTTCSPDEYRCHSCQNETFKEFQMLLNHFQEQHHLDEEKTHPKSSAFLCWKKGCNQYFNSLSILEKHFQEIHSAHCQPSRAETSSLNDPSILKDTTINLTKTSSTVHPVPSATTPVETKISSQQNIFSKSRERLISIGEDVVLHYLENVQNEENKNEILCDLCLKTFSSLSTLKVHYEEIHSIILSSRAIQHWIFLLQKLHQTSSSHDLLSKNKLKRQSSMQDFAQLKKIRSTHSDKYLFPSSSSSSSSLSPLATGNPLVGNSTSTSASVGSTRTSILTPTSGNNKTTGAGSHSLHPLQYYNFQDFSNGKRQRTRISDDQLQILRAHFDINNSPSDEQIQLMSDKTQLTNKVIKHWFRNTLFKERQRNKDSPYNFSNPPSSFNKFDLDEYQKTGTIVKKSISRDESSDSERNDLSSNDEQDLLSHSDSESDNEHFYSNPSLNSHHLSHQKQQHHSHHNHHHHHQQQHQQHSQQHNQQQQSRRANRTRFTDQQLRFLQDAFEANPYPKDDDLEILSQKLKLNSRVIVVWFQNARQKARKSYENNQTDLNPNQAAELIVKQEKDEGYSCKNCLKLFSRFAELMKHAKQCSPSLTKKHSTSKKDLIKAEPTEKNAGTTTTTTPIDPLSSYQMLVAAASIANLQQQHQQQPSPSTPFPLSTSFHRKDNYCDQCDKSFTSSNEFNEHQTLHMQALINAAAFFPLAAYHPAAAACAAAMAAISSQFLQNPPAPNLPSGLTPAGSVTATGTASTTASVPSTVVGGAGPRSDRLSVGVKASVSSIGSESSNEIEEEDGGTSIDSNDESRKTSNVNNGKRNRTTILPEQQDYLMSKYAIESNPSRKMLEEISSDVHLKKRVVQVWFQNTRARERKGNIKIEPNPLSSPAAAAEKKSFHCPSTFKSKSTLDNHLSIKHSDIYPNKDPLHCTELDLLPNASMPLSLSLSLSSCVNDDAPLDLSKSSLAGNQFDVKVENDDEHNLVHQPWNDEDSDQSTSEQDFPYSRQSSQTTTMTPTVKLASNGHLSPTDSHQSSNGLNGQRRFRTQMSPLQIKLMKAIFLEYRTPTMPECELLGKEIDLQKRVVQVWFQNARAKEKKNVNFFKSDLPDEYQPNNDCCLLCHCKYTLQNPQRDHLFTSKHIENIRSILSKQNSNLCTLKEEPTKKNSKVDVDPCSTTVLDRSSKDEQNQLMSYFNLINLMPMGIDPFNYGLMDPNIHGTPMFMLQLPCQALESILSLTKRDPHLTRAQYTQDGRKIEDCSDDEHISLQYQSIDVGFACKRCHLVWPLYDSCRCHALVCWQISPTLLPLSITGDEDLTGVEGYLFKIEQLLYRCVSCQTSYPTMGEYEKHIEEESHLQHPSSHSNLRENDSFKEK